MRNDNFEDPLGGWAISETLFLYLRTILPPDKTILELGSGVGTAELVKYWNVFSIEDNEEYVGKYHDNYIHAPLVKHKAIKNHDGDIWYNARVLEKELPQIDYDLILVDGPAGGTRAGFVKYWDLFKHDVPVIFDDVNRVRDWKIMKAIAGRLRKPYTVINTWEDKNFGVIL